MPQNAGPFTFANSTSVEDINKIPEHYRSFYDQDEAGAYNLKQDDIIKGATQGIDTLAKALHSERAGRKSDKESVVDLAPLSEYGDNPASIAESMAAKVTELQELAKKGSEVDIETVKRGITADLNKVHNSAIETANSMNESLKSQIYGVEVTSQGSGAFLEAGGNPEDLDLMMLAIQPFVKSVYKDGKVNTFIVDDDGKTVRFAPNEAGDMTEMTVRQRILEMKETTRFAKLFKSETAEGTGVHTQQPGVRVQHKAPTVKRSELTSVGKIAAGLAKKQYQH